MLSHVGFSSQSTSYDKVKKKRQSFWHIFWITYTKLRSMLQNGLKLELDIIVAIGLELLDRAHQQSLIDCPYKRAKISSWNTQFPYHWMVVATPNLSWGRTQNSNCTKMSKIRVLYMFDMIIISSFLNPNLGSWRDSITPQLTQLGIHPKEILLLCNSDLQLFPSIQ